MSILSTSWGTPDGNWSTFPIWIGTPFQRLSFLVSMNNTELLLPFSSKDHLNDTGFDPNLSVSWVPLDSGDHGSDFIEDDPFGTPNATHSLRTPIRRLPYSASGSPSQGLLGVGAVSSVKRGFKSFLHLLGSKHHASFIQSLWIFDIPNRAGLGYAYTSGAWYRQSPGALSLLGYEPSRLTSKFRSFPFSADDTKPLNLTLSSITVSRSIYGTENISILPTPISATLDSTLPFLELPEAACHNWQHTFGLQHDSETGFFVPNSTTLRILRELNTSVVLTLNGDNDPNPFDIILPFEAFDHEIQTTFDSRTTPYFPIKAAEQNRGNVLGRVLFQETYLIVNYATTNFTLGQAAFPHNVTLNEDFILLENRLPSNDPWLVGIILWLILWIIAIGLFVIMVALIILVLVPLILGLPKAWNLRKREQKLERYWIEVHTEGYEWCENSLGEFRRRVGRIDRSIVQGNLI